MYPGLGAEEAHKLEILISTDKNLLCFSKRPEKGSLSKQKFLDNNHYTPAKHNRKKQNKSCDQVGSLDFYFHKTVNKVPYHPQQGKFWENQVESWDFHPHQLVTTPNQGCQ